MARFEIYVTYKKGIFDPPGATAERALARALDWHREHADGSVPGRRRLARLGRAAVEGGLDRRDRAVDEPRIGTAKVKQELDLARHYHFSP